MNITCKAENRTRVLIVSLPGMMQNVLMDTFTNRNDVEVVGVANGGLSAVGMIRKQRPELVVIDSTLPDIEMSSLILWVKEEHQPICSLVLVETTQQEKKAKNAGADITLRSYSLPESLDKVLDNYRTNQSKTSE